jgi:antitoxin (DNA-binding transcriptional repressor) of toxin-antitoxin stability system
MTKKAEPQSRGKYQIDPKAGAGRVTMPDVEYGRGSSTVVSATEAARRFSDLINRASYQGETFVIERGGKPICQLGPLEERRCTFGDLVALLSQLPRPDDEYLDAVEEIIRNQEPIEPSPWDE